MFFFGGVVVLINHLEDDFSRLAFAGRMFRLIAVAPVVLPAFVRFTSSGRLSASLARALPFSEAKLVALAGQEAVSAAAPLWGGITPGSFLAMTGRSQVKALFGASLSSVEAVTRRLPAGTPRESGPRVLNHGLISSPAPMF